SLVEVGSSVVMSVKTIIRTSVTLFLLSICVAAQTPAPSPKSPRVERVEVRRSVAPQVVTIVHRLNGLKMFRLLRRSEEQAKVIAGLDESFNLTDDVHTN